MKNFISMFCLLIFTFSYAQIDDFNLKSKNLKGKITKIESATYTIDRKTGNYTLSGTEDSIYNENGDLIQNETQIFGAAPYKGSTSYYYNKNNQLIFFDKSENEDDPERTIYKYKDQKLIEVKNHGKFGSTTTLEYTKNGELSSEKIHDLGGELLRSSIYINFKDNNNYGKESIDYYKGKTSFVTSFEKKDGKIILQKYITFVNGKESTVNIYTNTYDKSGNVVEINNSLYKDPEIFDYILDNHGNGIKIHSKKLSVDDENFYHTFFFRKYTYQNGTTTGSVEPNDDFMNKYDK